MRGLRPGFLGAFSPVSCLFALPSSLSWSSSGCARFSLSLLSEPALAEPSEAEPLEPGRSPIILACESSAKLKSKVESPLKS